MTLAPLFTLVAGSIGGGLTLGGSLGLLGELMARAIGLSAALVIVTASAALVATFRPTFRRWLPERRCQVKPRVFKESSRAVAALRWGFTLGTGVSTYVVTPAFFALVALIAASSPTHALFLGFLYGATRGAVIAMAAGVVATRRDGSLVGQGLLRATRVPITALTLVAAVASIGVTSTRV